MGQTLTQALVIVYLLNITIDSFILFLLALGIEFNPAQQLDRSAFNPKILLIHLANLQYFNYHGFHNQAAFFFLRMKSWEAQER